MQHPQAIGKSIASQQRQLRSTMSGFQGDNDNWNSNGCGNGFSQSRRRSNQGNRGQQQRHPDPIVWDDVQTATRVYEELDFDE